MTDRPDRPLLTIVVPMRNEEAGIDAFLGRLLPALDRLDLGYEILCVDDGSGDGTWERLVEWRGRAPQLKLLSLSRNFGKEVALTAGLDAARGEAVVLIDADLQHPPELIGAFLKKWREGFDMVYAQRRGRRRGVAAPQRRARLLLGVPAPGRRGDTRGRRRFPPA